MLLPKKNANNIWEFHENGFLITKPAWVRSLRPLKPEGFYLITERFETDTQRIVLKGQIVQLGYNGDATPLIFFPRRDRDQNALVFPTSGMKAPQRVYQALLSVSYRGPHDPVATVN